MSPDDAYTPLARALRSYKPPCDGVGAFVADSRTDPQRAACASICARCSVADLCEAYALAAKVDFGFWAGADRAKRRVGRPRKASKPSPAARTVSGTHHTK